MPQSMLELVLDESKWLTASMLAALCTSLAWLRRCRRAGGLDRAAVLGAMNRFYGCMIGVMASGHLLAVAIAGARGTLRGSLWLLVPLGLVLAVPAGLLFRSAAVPACDPAGGRRSAALNLWLALALLASGLHNFPLAAPAALNLAYQFHRRPAVGRTIVTATILANLALFAGSLVFLASGRSFEEFSGM